MVRVCVCLLGVCVILWCVNGKSVCLLGVCDSLVCGKSVCFLGECDSLVCYW